MHSLILAVAAGSLALLISSASLAAPPEHITIDDCVAKKSAVEFPHAAHFDVTECSTCHHTQEDLSLETADQAKPCSECHNTPEKAGTPGCSETSLKKNPFHINCVSCHKEKEAGPTKCNDCHPKN
jgi:hypothetical protein